MTEENLPDEELEVVQDDDVLPLLQEEAVSGEEEDFLSEQTLRDERRGTSDVPAVGEGAAGVDFGEVPPGEEADASDDQANFGGSPLSRFDPDDLER